MKARANKLDPFAERLDTWAAEGKTLSSMQAELKADGCAVSMSSLSDFLSRRRADAMQATLLSQIASGAKACREVEEEFARNPAPGLEAIARLHRLLAFQLATAGAANPELLELSTKCTRMVLDYGKLQAKERDQALDERRVKLLEEAAERARKTEEVLESGISAEEQANRIREIFKKG